MKPSANLFHLADFLDTVDSGCSAPAGGPKPFTASGGPAKGAPPSHGDNVATKGMSASQQAANPDKIPVCAKCDNDIR